MKKFNQQTVQNTKKINYEKMDKTTLFQCLLKLIVELYETYDESECSQEEHFNNLIQFHKLNDECKRFVFEIFDGILINKNFFNDFIQGLINSKSVGVSRGRLTEYKVIVFLVVFRFEDISYNELKFFLYCQDPLVVNTILTFMFDNNLLESFALPQLENHYDTSYCMKIFEELKVKYQKMKKLVKKLKLKTSQIDEKEQQSIKSEIPKKKSPTKFEPFNLTQPKQRPISQKDEQIVQEKKPRKNTIKVDYNITVKDIEKDKENRRQQILKEKVQELENQKGPDLVTQKRAQEKQQQTQIEEPIQKQVKTIDNNYKDILYSEINIPEQRLYTKAMLLKEKQAEDIKIVEDAKKIQKLESNLRDSQEFKQWQLKMEEQDEIKRLQEVQQRKQENLMANINMKKAVEKDIKQKTQQAKELKIYKEKQIQQKQIKEQEEIQIKQKQVKVIEKEKQNCKKQQIIQHKNKQKLAQEKKKKIQDELKLKKLKEMKEREKKTQLVQKIREMEKRVFQISRFAEHKVIESEFLIENFTIQQLKERYKDIKKQYEREEELKRQKILLEKKKEQQELEKIKQKMKRKKEKQKEEFKQRQVSKQKQITQQKQLQEKTQLYNDQKIFDKITQKKKSKLDEQRRIDKIEKDFRMKQQFKKQESNMLQVFKNLNLQIGKENIARNQQVKQINEDYQQNLAKTKQINSKQKVIEEKIKEKQSYYENHQQIIQQFKN